MRGRFAWLGAGVASPRGRRPRDRRHAGHVARRLRHHRVLPRARSRSFRSRRRRIASPRANRFVESVFTAPVDRGDWLVAKILVLVTLAVAYYVALMPMLLVYVRARRRCRRFSAQFLLWTPGLLLSSIAVGTLIGVLFIGRSVAAPVGTGMGVLLAYAGLVPLQELMVAQGNGATRTGHLALAQSGRAAEERARIRARRPRSFRRRRCGPGSASPCSSSAPLALAAWIFLRAQGVETWEATPRAAVDDRGSPSPRSCSCRSCSRTRTTTSPRRPEQRARDSGALFARAGSSLALIDAGRPAAGPLLQHDSQSRRHGRDQHRRAYASRSLRSCCPSTPIETVTDLHVQLAGENGLQDRRRS